MGYIISSTSPFVSVKLTEKGRERLAKGALTFGYYGIGDSEIDYMREAAKELDDTLQTATIITPNDRQPEIKYFVTKNNETLLNSMTASNIRTVKVVLNNKADERGFFTGSTGAYTSHTSSDYVVASGTISCANLTGGTNVTVTAGLSTGDTILFKLTTDTTPAIVATTNIVPVPYLFYKIQGVNGDVLTLDRNTALLTASTSDIEYYVYKGGEVKDAFGYSNTTAYWDTGTLSFVANSTISTDDCPVWCANNVFGETIAGVYDTVNYEDYTRYGSYGYLGSKNSYFDLGLSSTTTSTSTNITCDGYSAVDTTSKAAAILHYTNNTISNYYGEFLYINGSANKGVSVEMPTIMYHRRNFNTSKGTEIGMRFIATGETLTLESGIEYVELIEDPALIQGSTPLVIGKVFPQLKMITIEDEEIIATMSYKSNRNWTLPHLEGVLKAPVAGAGNGSLAPGETIYLTYELYNSNVGLQNGLACQKYTKITNNTPSYKDVDFNINDIDQFPYMFKTELGTYSGTGFNAMGFRLLYQIVSGDTRPTTNNWKYSDFTSSLITGTDYESINPLLLENQNASAIGFVFTKAKLDVSASNYYSNTGTLNLPLKTNPSALNFGDERFFYGNISTYIGATTYKTIFGFTISGGDFKYTTNPTRNVGVIGQIPIRITEIGIYDNEKNLVAIGKMSQPITVLSGDVIMIELSIDF